MSDNTFIDNDDPRSVSHALGHVLALEFDRFNSLAFLDGISESLWELWGPILAVAPPDKAEFAPSVEAFCEGIKFGVRDVLERSVTS